MVNGQNGYFVLKFRGQMKGLPFRPQKICISAKVMVKMSIFVAEFAGKIQG